MSAKSVQRGGDGVATTAVTVSASAVATLRSRDLFAGAREIVIEHQGEQYRLRCTSKGKLILTK